MIPPNSVKSRVGGNHGNCQVCHHPLDEDGVCLYCAFNDAAEVSEDESLTSGNVSTEAAQVMAAFRPLELPCEFGRYRLERKVAAGGMGVVYEAEDTRLQRRVAIKIIRSAAFAAPEDVARFKAEAAAAARLDHPHIVPVYEVSDWDGQPFFTMKLLSGRTLAHLLNEEGNLPSREAASLISKLALAVHHAHERGVLHRDLKPGNVLLDHSGEPQLTDFGLAKFTGEDASMTLTQAHIGTPQYMSPEQAEGRARDVTAQSDVWSLGVMLYQALSGRLPFAGSNPAEIYRQIGEAEPASLLLSTTGSLRARRLIESDLSTITLRCLEKAPSKRIPSALFLSEELQRFLQGEPVLSRRVSPLERSFRWMRRHPWPVAALFCLTLAISAGLVGGVIAYQQMKEAQTARNEAQRSDATAKTALADALLRENSGAEARRVLATVPPELREENWAYLNTRSDASVMQLDLRHRYKSIAAVPTQPDVFAVAREDDVILLFNGRTGEKLLRIRAGLNPPMATPSGATGRYSIAVSPDGSEVAVGHECFESVRFYSTTDARLLRSWPCHTAQALFYRPGKDHPPQLLVQPFQNQTGKPARCRRLHDAATGQIVWEQESKMVADIAWMRDCFLPQGDALIAAKGRDLHLLDASTGSVIRHLPGPNAFIHAIAVHSSGTHATVGDESGAFTSFNPRTGEVLWRTQAEAGTITSLNYSLSGHRLIGTSTPWTQSYFRAAIWDSRSGSLVEPLHSLVEIGHHTVLHPLTGLLAISGGTCKMFDIPHDRADWIWHQFIDGNGISFMPDSKTLCFAGGDQVLIDLLPEGKTKQRFTIDTRGHVESAVPLPPGDRIYLETKFDGRYYRSLVENAKETGRQEVSDWAYITLPSPDGRFLWTGDLIIETASLKDLRPYRIEASGRPISSYWPKAEEIVSCYHDEVVIHNPINGAERLRTPIPPIQNSASMSPDSKYLAFGGSDKLVRLYETSTLKEIRRFRAHDASIIAVVLHPKAPHIATAADDGSIRLWNWQTGEMLAAWRPSFLGSSRICFSPDGTLLAAASADRKMHVWKVSSSSAPQIGKKTPLN